MTSSKDVSAPKKPLRVLIAAPKYIIGGHNKQAADLIANLRRDSFSASVIAITRHRLSCARFIGS